MRRATAKQLTIRRLARDKPQVVAAYIGKELQEGQIADITNPAEMHRLQVSLFRVNPRKKIGKWRLTVDLQRTGCAGGLGQVR